MKKKAKLLLAFGIPILLMGLVLGYWMVFYSSTTGYAITGSAGAQQLVITSDFTDQIMDLTTQTEIIQGLAITNNGAPIDLTLTKEILFTPTDPECSDMDIVFVFEDSAGVYEDQDLVHINGVAHSFTLTATAPYGELSCGGDYVITLTMQE